MKNNISRRLAFHIIGVLIMTFGIAFTSKGGVGVASVSTISFAGSKIIPLTFGQCSSLFQAFCFIAQIVIKRKFSAMDLLQIPMVYLFGFLLDIFNALLMITASNIVVGCLFVLTGTLIFSLGLRIIVGADIVLNPTDGIAKIIGEKAGWAMSKAKFIFDICIVSTSAILTLAFLGSPFIAVGLGTIITMLCTGPAIGVYTKLFPFFDIPKGESLNLPLS